MRNLTCIQQWKGNLFLPETCRSSQVKQTLLCNFPVWAVAWLLQILGAVSNKSYDLQWSDNIFTFCGLHLHEQYRQRPWNDLTIPSETFVIHFRGEEVLRKMACKDLLSLDWDMKLRWTVVIWPSWSRLLEHSLHHCRLRACRVFAKLGGGKMDVRAGEGMVDTKCIMKRRHAELLEPLNGTWTSTHCFYFGILYWDVWYFGREKG